MPRLLILGSLDTESARILVDAEINTRAHCKGSLWGTLLGLLGAVESEATSRYCSVCFPFRSLLRGGTLTVGVLNMLRTFDVDLDMLLSPRLRWLKAAAIIV